MSDTAAICGLPSANATYRSTSCRTSSGKTAKTTTSHAERNIETSTIASASANADAAATAEPTAQRLIAPDFVSGKCVVRRSGSPKVDLRKAMPKYNNRYTTEKRPKSAEVTRRETAAFTANPVRLVAPVLVSAEPDWASRPDHELKTSRSLKSIDAEARTKARTG